MVKTQDDKNGEPQQELNLGEDNTHHHDPVQGVSEEKYVFLCEHSL